MDRIEQTSLEVVRVRPFLAWKTQNQKNDHLANIINPIIQPVITQGAIALGIAIFVPTIVGGILGGIAGVAIQNAQKPKLPQRIQIKEDSLPLELFENDEGKLEIAEENYKTTLSLSQIELYGKTFFRREPIFKFTGVCKNIIEQNNFSPKISTE